MLQTGVGRISMGEGGGGGVPLVCPESAEGLHSQHISDPDTDFPGGWRV